MNTPEDYDDIGMALGWKYHDELMKGSTSSDHPFVPGVFCAGYKAAMNSEEVEQMRKENVALRAALDRLVLEHPKGRWMTSMHGDSDVTDIVGAVLQNRQEG